jgi:hypothetical protein
VKYYVFLAAAALAAAQSASSSYSTDVNGNPVQGPSVVSNDGKHTETSRSINGRTVPLEQTDERVLSQTATSRVTEKIIRKFDATGQLISTERVLTEEQKHPSGSVVNTTTFRSDINGAMQQDEHKTVETNTHGPSTDINTVIERPTLNGFETVEKRAAVSETSNNVTHTDETVYRAAQSGGFFPAVRKVTDITQNGTQTVEKTAQYEPIANVSGLQLTRQTVSTTTTRPDGSSVDDVNYFGPAVPGNVRDPNAAQQLYEQDVIERKPGAGGTTVESLTARRASMADPTHLGPAIKVSETVCTGKCSDKSNK